MAYMQGENEIVRESPFVQVGGQTMRTPTSVNLDEMFKTPSTPTGQFQAPAGPEVAPIVTEGPYVSESIGAGAFLEASEEWTKYPGVGGDYYMPSSGKTGDYHEAPDGQLYEWRDGEGWALVEDGASQVLKFKGSVSKSAFHVSAYRGLLDIHSSTYNMQNTVNDLYANNIGATAAIGQLETGRTAAIQVLGPRPVLISGGRDNILGEQRQREIDEWDKQKRDINAAFDSMIDSVDGLKRAIQSLTQSANGLGVNISDLDLSTTEDAREAKSRINNALIGKDYTGFLKLQGTTITQDFGSGVSDMMQQIDSGEFSFYDENGDLDIEGMISAGGAQGWLGESLQAATESGFLQNDFMQWKQKEDENGVLEVDADGNPVMEEVFSDEIQSVMDAMDDQMSDQQQRFMSDLKYSAAQQGFSVEDVIFSKQRLAFENEATAQYANEFAGMLDREMEAGYTSMGASLESLIRQNWSDEKALTFKTEYERQMSEALKDYRVQDQILGEEAAQAQLARRNNIIIGLVSAAAAAFGMIL